MKCRMQVNIKGIVQGVGFRPFVYNLAKKHNLVGYVLNNTSGVFIDVEGEQKAVKKFIQHVNSSPPPQAEIYDMQSQQVETFGYQDFTIQESKDQEEKFVPISPELSTCEECVTELFDPMDRRYRYPFINCTNCGPRFSIVQDIPYDRKFTTMSVFPMCNKCQAEYDNPGDRRFHAQPNACPFCGPQLSLKDHNGREIQVEDVISDACRLFKEGYVIAVKGLGGYHLACDAFSIDAVKKLRARKFREYKPFAIMARDLITVKNICYVSREEEKQLTDTKRPILLLHKRNNGPVAKEVAPNQIYLGVMLPYTPLHHLLLTESGLVLVMTSGNISSEPIVFDDLEAIQRLKGIADYFVTHNREIYIRTDDSVSRIWNGSELVMRRSRGYAPHPLLMKLPFEEQILSCGAELKNTFCLTRGNYAFLSHHIGDLENIETLSAFEKGIEHFKRIFNIKPAYIAYDLHPEYLSTKYALSLDNVQKLGIQHHHAHVVSCMGDNSIEEKVIGVAFDGTGYGTDGTIWGGEFFICDFAGFQRIAHFEYIPLPGGEKAIKEPWRMAASCLKRIYDDDLLDVNIDFVKELDRNKWQNLKKMINNGINSPLTSSTGRLFDAVSALIGIRREVYYEGQAAIELEMAANPEEKGVYNFDLREDGDKTEIVINPLFKDIVSDLKSGIGKESISAKFHNTVAHIILKICKKIFKEKAIDRVVLSGGVFQNMMLLEKTLLLLRNKDFRVYTHHRVPPNDGGIALGQAIIANEWIKKGKFEY